MRAGRALAAVLAAALVAGCQVVGGQSAGGQDPRRLQYVVVPHPDDEYAAWSLVGGRADEYPVFLLLTRGEASAVCDGLRLQAEHGERAPRPQPFAGPGSDACARQRVDAWHAFLDALAADDPTLDSPDFIGTYDGELLDTDAAVDATGYDLHVGDRSARVVFDLGDGRLRADEVTWAVQTARRMREDRFPVTAEGDVVGATFHNDGHPGCVAYGHDDHAAVDEALWEVDQGVPGVQWGRTCHSDPRVEASGGQVFSVPEDVHEAVWAVDPPPVDPRGNPDARRTGHFQRIYGWLAFTFEPPNPGTYWEAGEHDDVTFFSRHQAFWRRFGD